MRSRTSRTTCGTTQGGQGLITLADGVYARSGAQCLHPAQHRPKPAPRPDRAVRRPRHPHADLTARVGGRPGAAPDPAWPRVFGQLNCASCHGGGGWASSRRDYTPPPNPARCGRRPDRAPAHRKWARSDATARPTRSGENGTPSRGADGFNPPSLLGAHALAPYLRNGSAATLDQVMSLVPHRSAGTGGVDGLTDPQDRADLVRIPCSRSMPRPRPFDIPGPVAVDLGIRIDPVSGIVPTEAGERPSQPAHHPDHDHVLAAQRGVLCGSRCVTSLGRRVATLVDRMQGAGRHEVSWDRQNGLRAAGRRSGSTRATRGHRRSHLDQAGDRAVAGPWTRVTGAREFHRRPSSWFHGRLPAVLLAALLLAATVPASAAPAAPSAGELARWQRLAHAVTITRDDWGSLTSTARRMPDAVFGMEYAQAEDDFNRDSR